MPKQTIKLISWNVNGYRAVMKKDFLASLHRLDADIVGLQERLQYKLDFYRAFFDYAEDLRRQGKSLIITGDFNTAHNEIDLKHPGPNSKRSGFLPVERQWLDRIIDMGYDWFGY